MEEHLQELAQQLICLIEKDEIDAIREFLGEHQFHIAKVVRAQIDKQSLLQRACLSSVCVLTELVAVLGPKHIARQELTRIVNDVCVLHVVASHGRLDVLRMLLEERLVLPHDLDITTLTGESPLQLAQEAGHHELATYITEMASSKAENSTTAPQQEADEDGSTSTEPVAENCANSEPAEVDENDNELPSDCDEIMSDDARAATIATTRCASATDGSPNKTIADKARTLGRTLLRVLRLKPKQFPLPVGVNYDKAMKKLSKKSKESVELLGMLAYIDCKHSVSSEIIRGTQEAKSHKATLARANKYAFVQVKSGQVHLCQEVQDELLAKLADDVALTRALTILLANIEENINSFMNFSPDLLNHAIKIWSYANKNEELVVRFSKIPVMILNDIFNNGKIELTINFANENIEILQQFAPDCIDILYLQRILACALQACGKSKEAVALLHTVLSNFEEKHAEDEGLLYTLHSRANVMVASGQASSTAYEEVTTKMRAQFGETHSATLRCQLDHACALLQQQDFNKALDIFTQLCTEHTNVFGISDRRTLDARKNHAHALACAEKLDESLAMYTDVEEKMTRVLGEEHVVTLQALVEKADVLLKLKQFDISIRAYHEVLTSLEKQYGPFSPKTLLAKLKLAKAIQTSGSSYDDYPTPDQLYEEILNKDFIDKHDPDVLLDLRTRIEALKAVNSEDSEVEEAYERLINMTIEMLGESHPVCCKSQEELAGFFESRGRDEEAETMLVHVLQTRISVLGEDHAMTLRALEALADIHVKRSNLKDAIVAYSRVFNVTTIRLGDDNINTLLVRQKRACTMRKIGVLNIREADVELGIIIEKMKQLLGEDHPTTVNLHDYIASISE